MYAPAETCLDLAGAHHGVRPGCTLLLMLVLIVEIIPRSIQMFFGEG
jgi:hypothetical protein